MHVCMYNIMIYLYIIWTVQNLFCFLGGGKDIYVAPFVDVKAFWEEYCQYNVAQYTPVTEVARISTFRQAFKICENLGIQKLQSKGTINTCEICNNASDLLRNRSKITFKLHNTFHKPTQVSYLIQVKSSNNPSERSFKSSASYICLNNLGNEITWIREN